MASTSRPLTLDRFRVLNGFCQFTHDRIRQEQEGAIVTQFCRSVDHDTEVVEAFSPRLSVVSYALTLKEGRPDCAAI